MKKLDRVSLDKKLMALRVRAFVRLRANEQYHIELNDALPAAEAHFDQAVLEGRLLAPIALPAYAAEPAPPVPKRKART